MGLEVRVKNFWLDRRKPLKVGDVVKSKNGSRLMTIDQIHTVFSAAFKVSCVWFDGHQLKRAEFYIKDLERVK